MADRDDRIAAKNRPVNILTLLTDQQRYDSLSCMGNSVVHTPNLDRLAREGALFSNAVCASPLCGPSRASLLSGLFFHGHGLMGNAEIAQPGMKEEVDTVDEILNRNGFLTEYHGKWHTGRDNRGCYYGGLDHYIDLYKDYLDQKYPPQKPRRDQKIDRHIRRAYRFVPLDEMMTEAEKGGYEMPHHNEAGELEVEPGDTLTAWTAKRVIAFLKSKPKQPFALTCSLLHPHAPLLAARPYFALFDPEKMPLPDNVEDGCEVSKPKSVPRIVTLTPEGVGTFMAIYFGLVKEIDDWVGRILDELDRNGLRENTMVIFLSDHGELMGNHGTFSKMKMFEESIRVPLLMRLPGRIKPGIRLDSPVSGVDIMPTILDFANIEVPGAVHGKSLKADLTGEGKLDREYALCEFRDSLAIRSREWKLILNPSRLANIREMSMLYDLERDPGEVKNLLSRTNKNARNLAKAEELRKNIVAILDDMHVQGKTIDTYSNFVF